VLTPVVTLSFLCGTKANEAQAGPPSLGAYEYGGACYFLVPTSESKIT